MYLHDDPRFAHCSQSLLTPMQQANGLESEVHQRKLLRKNRLADIKIARRQRSSDGKNHEVNRTIRRASLRMLDEFTDTSASSAKSTRVVDQEPDRKLSEVDSQDQLAALFEELFGKDDENAAQETTSPRNTNSDPARTRNTVQKGGATSQDFLGNLLDELFSKEHKKETQEATRPLKANSNPVGSQLARQRRVGLSQALIGNSIDKTLGKDNEHAAQEATRPPNTASALVSTRNTGRGSDVAESRPKWLSADGV